MTRCSNMAMLIGVVVAGCGLSLDLDPPEPEGMDAGRTDAGADAQVAECLVPADCAGGDPCSGPASCEAGRCVPGLTLDCDDGDPCNGLESCQAGTCVASPPDSCADDGDPCNGWETCVPFVGCTSVEPLLCDDGVGCTVDTCEPTGCTHAVDHTVCDLSAGGVCDPTRDCQYSTCNVGSTCLGGPCQNSRCEGVVCQRENLCAAGEGCCIGACVPAGCDDRDPCTDDTCGPSGCEHTPTIMPTICSDGDPCTIGDRCAAGVCQPTGPRPCRDIDLCTADSCGPSGCVHMLMSPGTRCARNARCDSRRRCQCDAGFMDCTGDGNCDCAGRCLGGMCLPTIADCTTGAVCIDTLLCCTDPVSPLRGLCGEPTCGSFVSPGCCPPMT